jgi:hypothetical protein
MHAVIGRVKIKPERADEALSMIEERGVAMLQGMAGSTGGYWARTLEGDVIQLVLALRYGGQRSSRGGDLQHASRHARRAGDIRQRGCL